MLRWHHSAMWITVWAVILPLEVGVYSSPQGEKCLGDEFAGVWKSKTMTNEGTLYHPGVPSFSSHSQCVKTGCHQTPWDLLKVHYNWPIQKKKKTQHEWQELEFRIICYTHENTLRLISPKLKRWDINTHLFNEAASNWTTSPCLKSPREISIHFYHVQISGWVQNHAMGSFVAHPDPHYPWSWKSLTRYLLQFARVILSAI